MLNFYKNTFLPHPFYKQHSISSLLTEVTEVKSEALIYLSLFVCLFVLLAKLQGKPHFAKLRKDGNKMQNST